MYFILSVVVFCFFVRIYYIKDVLFFVGFVEVFIYGWSEVGLNLVDE